MKVEKEIRIIAQTEEKEGQLLKGINIPFTCTILVDKGAKVYFRVAARSMFRKYAEKELEKRFETMVQALSTQYSFEFIEERAPDTQLSHCYACTYDPSKISNLVDSLIKNDVRTEIVMNFMPRKDRVILSFVVASDRDIGPILKSLFDRCQEISKSGIMKARKGKHINSHLVKAFGLPLLPGIDSIPETPIKIPARLAPENSEDHIRPGTIIDPQTSRELVSADLPIQNINRHVGIFGGTGTGKTNLLYHLILSLHGKVPILVLDWKKDYLSLMKKVDATVFDFSSNILTFNFLKPVGEPATWAKILAGVLAEITSGGGAYASGAFSIFLELIDMLYRKHGIYEGSKDYPTIFDLLDAINNYRRGGGLSNRQKDWIASTTKTIKSLTIGSTRDAFSVREGISLETLINEDVCVIELEALGDPKSKALFISVLLEKIRVRQLQKQERDALHHIVIIEEAHNLLARNQEASSVLPSTYREIRSLGVGLMAVSQVPSEFCKDALGNTNTFFIFGLKHRDDLLAACGILGFHPRDMNVIEGLKTGVCFMKDERECVPIKIPFIEKEMVRDDEIKRTVTTREEVATNFARRRDVQNRVTDLTDREWNVLKMLCESVAYNNTTLMEKTGYSNYEISKTLDKLIKKGLIRYRYAKKQGVGGRKRKVSFPMPYAEEAYRAKYGVYPDKRRARRNVKDTTHKEMEREIIKAMGLKVKKHERFDILLDQGLKDIAIEIETGSNNNHQIYSNVQKSIEEYGEAHFIALNEGIYHAIIQQAGKYSFDNRTEAKLNIAIYKDFLPRKEWVTLVFK